MNLAVAQLAIDPAEEYEDFEVIIKVRSIKHDCNIAYPMSGHEQSNSHFEDILRSLKQQMRNFIKDGRNG